MVTATQSSTALSADSLRGITLMVVSVGLFSTMDAMVKWLGDYPTMQIVFFRSLFAFIPLSYLIYRQGISAALAVKNVSGHVYRCVVGLLAMTGFFYAYSLMPLADAIAIGFAAPIFITALSVPLLGERVGLRRWIACLVGFLGVLIMVQPGSGVFEWSAMIALGATVFYALAIISVRKLSRTETSISIVFYFTLSCTLISALFLPFQWTTPSSFDLLLLIGVGLIGGLAQIAMTQAFRLSEVSLVMPFEYTAMIWAAGLGYLVWSDIPGLNIWFGVLVVASSGLYILYRETKLGLRRGVARKLQVKR